MTPTEEWKEKNRKKKQNQREMKTEEEEEKKEKNKNTHAMGHQRDRQRLDLGWSVFGIDSRNWTTCSGCWDATYLVQRRFYVCLCVCAFPLVCSALD